MILLTFARDRREQRANDVIVVSLDVRIWSGRKKLRPEDLTASGRLPPKDLVSLGSKRLCDPDALQPFLQLKRRAEARCQAVGVRFARAFAIPKAAAKPVLSDLNSLAEQFRQARAAFLADLRRGARALEGAVSGLRAIDRGGDACPRPWCLEARIRVRGVCHQCRRRRWRARRAAGARRRRQSRSGARRRALPGGGERSREFVRHSLTGRDEVTQKIPATRACDRQEALRDSRSWTPASRRS